MGQVLLMYLTAFVQPFGTLWFIYMLPVFYLVTRMLRNVDPKWLLGGALVLQLLPIHTGSTLIDEFASRYVFFVIGFVFYRQFFSWAQYAVDNIGKIALFVGGWFAVNSFLTSSTIPEAFQNILPTHNAVPIVGAGSIGKLADLPFVALGLGAAGTLALIALAAIIIQVKWLTFMRWVGKHSIVIYLAFFLPMAISRILLLKFADGMLSTGSIAAIVTGCAFCGPVIFYWLVEKSGVGGFLFERPISARLDIYSNPTVAKTQPAQ